MQHRKPRWRRRIVLAGGVALAVGLGVSWRMGSILIAPARTTAGQPPEDIPLRPIEFLNAAGERLYGWTAAPPEPRGCVILLHGVRGNRRQMVGRARFLHAAGFATLLIDQRAHGESDGDSITFGARESLDARAAVAFMRAAWPALPIAAIGCSLGGASCLLGEGTLDVDVLVLEAVYPAFTAAVANRLRMRFGPVGGWLAPLLTLQVEPRLGIGVDQLRPIDRIADVTAAVLVIGGEDDLHTTPAESRALFAAAPEPKELWLIPDAGHVDFHALDPAAYEARVLAFLKREFGGR